MLLVAAVVVLVLSSSPSCCFGQGALTSRSDLIGLYELRASLGLRARDWPARRDPCSAWAGVDCSGGRVVAVRLTGLHRTRRGRLNPRFAVDGLRNLTALAVFNASGFLLPGHIPAWFGSGLPASVSVVDLRRAGVNGTIPPDLGLLVNLKTLVLAGNRLSGDVPTSIWSIPGLELLDLSANNLTSELPNASRLAGNATGGVLNVSSNLLYGSIGPGIGVLATRFKLVDFSNNYFDGAVEIAQNVSGNVVTATNCFANASNQRSRADCEAFYMRMGLSLAEIPPPPPPPALDPPPAFSPPVVPASPRKRKRYWKYILPAILSAAALVVVVLLAAMVVCLMRRRGRSTTGRRNSSVNAVQSSPVAVPPSAVNNPLAVADEFTYEQLLRATGGFGDENHLKHGHSGDIYYGVLENGVHVVVKRVGTKSVKKDTGVGQFGLSDKFSHTRIVPLLGHLMNDEQEELMVYQYMPKGDLTNALHKKPGVDDERLPSLDWITRLKIAIGVAEALCFLHDECNPPLVHRDIQASSVLLDDKFEVRLGSLSEICTQQGAGSQNVLSRILRSSKSLEKNISGPPATRSYDIYCFGKVLLELVTGNLGISGSSDAATEEWLANTLSHINIHEKESTAKIIDPSLIVDEDHLQEAWAVAIVAKTCLSAKPSRRPMARHVLKALENPLRVVNGEPRSSNSAHLRATSSRSSWRAAFHGNWHQNSDIVRSSGRMKEERSFRHSVKSQGSGGERSFSLKSSSREIVPEPLGSEDNITVEKHDVWDSLQVL